MLSIKVRVHMCIYIHICICIQTYVYMHSVQICSKCVCTYIHIYICRAFIKYAQCDEARKGVQCNSAVQFHNHICDTSHALELVATYVVLYKVGYRNTADTIHSNYGILHASLFKYSIVIYGMRHAA